MDDEPFKEVETLMGKRLLILGLAFLCTGCVSIRIPKYITDKNPYKKTVLSPYDDVLAATRQALEKLGWPVTDVTDPGMYEHNRDAGVGGKQALLFTKTKEAARILYSRYTTINVYLTALKDGTEIEIRYLAKKPCLFTTFDAYRNDRLVDQIFDQIQNGLKP